MSIDHCTLAYPPIDNAVTLGTWAEVNRPKDFPDPSHERSPSMFTALIKSFFVVGVLAMAMLGTASAGAFAALVLGAVEMAQVTEWLQLGVDNSHYAIATWGGASTLVGVRAIMPFVMASARAWMASFVKRIIEEVTSPGK